MCVIRLQLTSFYLHCLFAVAMFVFFVFFFLGRMQSAPVMVIWYLVMLPSGSPSRMCYGPGDLRTLLGCVRGHGLLPGHWAQLLQLQ